MSYRKRPPAPTRKITYLMCPNATQKAAMEEMIGLYCRTHNTLLEESTRRFEEEQKRYSFEDMCKDITVWRGYVDALKDLHVHTLQVTASRVALAVSGFIRRAVEYKRLKQKGVENPDKPGYPRFKSAARYSGWGYKQHGNGWKFQHGERENKLGKKVQKHGTIWLSGIGNIPLRGKGRFKGTPVACEVMKKGDKYYLSVSFEVTPKEVSRRSGTKAAAFDWGLQTLLTLFDSDGKITEIENPRWLKKKLDAIKALQKLISEKEREAKEQAGLDPDQPLEKGQKFPITKALKRLYRQLGGIHSKVSRQRKDFYHKLSAFLVSQFWFLGTEALAVKEMVNKAKAKEKKTAATPGEGIRLSAKAETGTRRAIQDGAPSMLLGMIKTKAEEAGSEFAQANTRRLKPTQRCHHCGTLVKKDLSERRHRCPSCGCACGRDENAAKTLYRWMFEGDFWSGTVAMGALPSETPSFRAG